jgi:hypothetical protein
MRLSQLVIATAAAATLTFSLAAQDRSYWISNVASQDIMEVTPWGKVLRSINLGANIRRTVASPTSGLVWTLLSGTSDFYLINPSGAPLGPITFPLGSPLYVAIDAQGDAWISGTTGVVHYDFVGTEIQQYPLTVPNPRGITIDNQGNKWIAHRELFNAAVSRINPAGVVTTHPVTGVRPVGIIADFRGLGVPSHIWVTCDDNGSLLELDENGVELNNYTIAPDINETIFDLNGDLWVRHSGTASLWQVNPNTGAILNTYAIQSPTDPSYTGVNGISLDTLGRILAVQRLNFGPPQPQPAPPCEVQRINPATGAMEVSTVLAVGGAEGWGTLDGPSTPVQWAMVVDPTGDADLDGDTNLAEIQNGTSPVDASSSSRFSIDTTGNSGIGGTLSINVRQTSGVYVWATAFTSGLLAAPVQIPGFVGDLVIDPSTAIVLTTGVGSTNTPLTIPTNPALAGFTMYMQSTFVDGSLFYFSNLSGIAVW